ncbi:nitric oxide dioxygenase [Pedococcus cremeus]|uniref:nitric oxide dioxygenase n=1 Tax=Pedococcus cremeus TaxID=587636 RepID=A0A1H9XJL0_9MICO|nr:globin domain-containing protein [Pedococcus cremeus]SES46370.1 nitric oxide dioxygenase [Pedococcus cremeus]
MLSPQSETIVRATAPVVAEHAVQITSRFYPSMFEAHPELLSLFNMGNQANGDQRRALASAVVAYATHLIDPQGRDFRPVMERIAHKHVSLGIHRGQYPIVGHHLMGAVAEVVGEAVTPEVAAAWEEVYWLFATELIAEEARLYKQAGVDPLLAWRDYEVVDRVDEALDTVTLLLAPTDERPVPSHQPGQYVSVAVTLPDGTRQPRQYTVSTGYRPNTLQITVRRVRGVGGAPDGAVSSHLHDRVAVGDLLEVGPPAGDMVLEERAAPLLLISAGVGITPVAAILDDLAARGTSRPVTVVHADRSAASHPLFESTSTSLQSLGDAVVHTWYEDVDAIGRLRGARSGFMDLDEVPLTTDADVFMCGPLPFMRKVRAGLVRRGVPASQIRYEVFGPDLLAAAG